MAASAGPRIRSSANLLYKMDSRSLKTKGSDESNRLASLPWTIGTGSDTGYSQNGDGNSRILDDTPFGTKAIIWDVSNQDAGSNADGGWNGSGDGIFDIDNTKYYRFSVWIQRKVIGNGSTYLGLYGRNSSGSNIGVTRRSNGATGVTNPYFAATGWWGNANEWYLVVGHVWPVGSGSGSVHPDTGIYNTSGTKVANCGDFVWETGNVKSNLRTYLYYSTNTSTNQQFWDPRVDELGDTNAPTLQQLLNGRGTRFNLIRRGQSAETSLRKVKWTDSGFEFGAQDDDKSIEIPLSGNFNKTEGTISCWLYPTSYSGSNGIFVNREDSNPNATDWLWIGAWGSGSLLYFRTGNGSACCNQDLTLSSFSTNHAPVNTWTHLTVTWKSSGTANIYINGVLAGTRSIGSIPNTNPSSNGRIGLGHFSGSTGSWNGKIDQFKIFSAQLTAEEVLQNYRAFKGRYN